MQSKIEILCTGQLDDLIVQTAAEQGLQIDRVPFISIQDREDMRIREEIILLSQQKKNVLFTSVNAVKAVLKKLQNQRPSWRIFCVGTATRNLLADSFGLTAIQATASSSAELAGIIAANSLSEEIIFFCGNIKREELPDYLRKKNIPVREVTVYETTLQHQRIEKKYQGILFFSPSEVKSFFFTNKIAPETILFAIGKTTAGEIKNYTTNTIIVCSIPGKEGLVKDAINFFSVAVNPGKPLPIHKP